MACDRPLAKLDPDMGGFIPGPQMPVSVSMEPSKNNGMVMSSKEGGGGRPGANRKAPPPAQNSRTAVNAQQPQAGQSNFELDLCWHARVFLCGQRSCVHG